MIFIKAKKWFQKTYGNTYHSCLVEKITGTGKKYKREVIGYEPFTYGYGDHYLNTAAQILSITERDLRQDMRNNREKYLIISQDVNRKKDLG